MSKDFSYLRSWLTGEKHPNLPPFRPVILECIPSRSGMSMTVYDRGELLYTINGCGFDRLGCALAEFLEASFQPELQAFVDAESASSATRYMNNSADWLYCLRFPAIQFHRQPFKVSLEGSAGFSSVSEIAQAIGLKVHQSESKAGTLIIIEKGK